MEIESGLLCEQSENKISMKGHLLSLVFITLLLINSAFGQVVSPVQGGH